MRFVKIGIFILHYCLHISFLKTWTKARELKWGNEGDKRRDENEKLGHFKPFVILVVVYNQIQWIFSCTFKRRFFPNISHLSRQVTKLPFEYPTPTLKVKFYIVDFECIFAKNGGHRILFIVIFVQLFSFGREVSIKKSQWLERFSSTLHEL